MLKYNKKAVQPWPNNPLNSDARQQPLRLLALSLSSQEPYGAHQPCISSDRSRIYLG